MAGELITTATSVTCAHNAPAQAAPTTARVRAAGAVVLTTAAGYTVAGCTFVPAPGNGPCVSARWVAGAGRVLIGGVPAALVGRASTSTPTGTPLTVTVVQTRAKGR